MNIDEMKAVVESLDGWCTVDKAMKLYEIIKGHDSQLTVELGVFGGRSMIPMAIAHKEKGSGILIGIDAWRKEPAVAGTNSPLNDKFWNELDFKIIYDKCQRQMIFYDVIGVCDTVRMTTQSAAALFGDESIDVIHQDSGHNVETIISELELYIPKLKTGGYWIADDTDWIEAKGGYDKLPEFNLTLVEDFIQWQIWRKV